MFSRMTVPSSAFQIFSVELPSFLELKSPAIKGMLSSHSLSARLNPLLEVLIALPRRGDEPMRIQKGNISLSSLPQAKWDLDVNKVLANAS